MPIDRLTLNGREIEPIDEDVACGTWLSGNYQQIVLEIENQKFEIYMKAEDIKKLKEVNNANN